MRFFFALLAIIAATLITTKPELAMPLLTTALMTAGIMALLPSE